ncbi:MAG: PorV/PorQ family protein [Chitinispirillaceae bacterium]|nr:PorV/PorQ family protein [Chitinispirillaceae bacterium]
MKPIRSSIINCTVTAIVACTGGRAQLPEAGTEIFSFLNLNYDARSVSMAGASVAAPNGIYGMFINPASLSFTRGSMVMAGYRDVGQGVFGAPLAYALPQSRYGIFAVGAQGLTSGLIEGIDIGPDGSEVPTGFSARADYYAGSLTWSRKVTEFFTGGLTVKGIYNLLSDGFDTWSAEGIAFDAGLQYRYLDGRLMYGLVARNVGFLLSGYEDGDAYPFPTALEMGVSYVPQYLQTLRLFLDLNKMRNHYLLFEPGVEFELIKDQMLVRGGYAVSWRDLEYFIDKLGGETGTTYHRSTRAALCMGAGFAADLIDRRVRMDVGVEFHTAQNMPALIATVMMEL